jgi:hypothetical protein
VPAPREPQIHRYVRTSNANVPQSFLSSALLSASLNLRYSETSLRRWSASLRRILALAHLMSMGHSPVGKRLGPSSVDLPTDNLPRESLVMTEPHPRPGWRAKTPSGLLCDVGSWPGQSKNYRPPSSISASKARLVPVQLIGIQWRLSTRRVMFTRATVSRTGLRWSRKVSSNAR